MTAIAGMEIGFLTELSAFMQTSFKHTVYVPTTAFFGATITVITVIPLNYNV